MRAIDADALQLAIVEEGQANKRKKYIIGDIWELTGAEIREVINSQPTIQPEHLQPWEVLAAQVVLSQPTIQPKRGKWIKISPANIYECSECGKSVMTNDICAYDFCHGCGADMREVTE